MKSFANIWCSLCTSISNHTVVYVSKCVTLPLTHNVNKEHFVEPYRTIIDQSELT